MSGAAPSTPRGVEGLFALVTGGTSGIGEAVVRALLAGGAAGVAFTGRRAALGAALAAELNGAAGGGGGGGGGAGGPSGAGAGAPPPPPPRALFFAGDATDAAARAAAVRGAEAAFGRLDVLFNNAGEVAAGGVADTPLDAWARVLDLNLTAAFAFTQLVLPGMLARGAGAIVNCASDWGVVGAPGYAAYCVSKAGLVQLTRVTALECAARGVRCNAVAPGDTRVPRWETDGYATGGPPVPRAQADADAAGALPIGRPVEVGEVAAAVLFLAGRGCEAVTGAVLAVDGGNTAR